jgi:hypothetical protein
MNGKDFAKNPLWDLGRLTITLVPSAAVVAGWRCLSLVEKQEGMRRRRPRVGVGAWASGGDRVGLVPEGGDTEEGGDTGRQWMRTGLGQPLSVDPSCGVVSERSRASKHGGMTSSDA